MRAWIYTMLDVALMGGLYWAFCWLFGAQSSLAGWAMSVGMLALLTLNRNYVKGKRNG